MKNYKILKNISLDSKVLSGYTKTSFSKKDLIKVTYWIEKNEPIDINDFDKIIHYSENIFKTLNQEAIDSIKVSISKELTDSSFSQSDYKPTEEDYIVLKQSLDIMQINFYEEDFVMELVSKPVYPDMKITSQLSYDFEIIETMIF